jgi:hypothetical protein
LVLGLGKKIAHSAEKTKGRTYQWLIPDGPPVVKR